MSAFAEGYVDVATRIAEFRAKFPDGSLRVVDPTGQPYRLLEVDGATFLVVVVAAYRTPDDAAPGIGMAQEQIPGRTPYTRGSELQNAETSAWGRAIVAALAADTRKGVASADEVRNRQAERDDTATDRLTDKTWLADIHARLEMARTPGEIRGLDSEAHQVFAEGRLTVEDAQDLRAAMATRKGLLDQEPALT